MANYDNYSNENARSGDGVARILDLKSNLEQGIIADHLMWKGIELPGKAFCVQTFLNKEQRSRKGFLPDKKTKAIPAGICFAIPSHPTL